MTLIQVICPPNGTAVLKGLTSTFSLVATDWRSHLQARRVNTTQRKRPQSTTIPGLYFALPKYQQWTYAATSKLRFSRRATSRRKKSACSGEV